MRISTSHRATVYLVMLALLAGCGEVKGPAPASMMRTELFFGLSRPGGQISEAQWQAFVDHEITPRFPDGFTVLDGNGQWESADGSITHERSKILLILHVNSGDAIKKIEEIRAAYKEQFHQESVLRESTKANVSF